MSIQEPVESVAQLTPDDLAWTWGDRVAKVRRLAGLTQTDIARVCQVTQDSVSNWETGKGSPPRTKRLPYADRIAAVTGAPVTYLLDISADQLPELRSADPASPWKCESCGLEDCGCGLAGGPAPIGPLDPFGPHKPAVDGSLLDGDLVGAR